MIGQFHNGPYLVMEAQRRENIDLSMRKIFSIVLPFDTDLYQKCGEKKFQELSICLSIRPQKCQAVILGREYDIDDDNAYATMNLLMLP